MGVISSGLAALLGAVRGGLARGELPGQDGGPEPCTSELGVQEARGCAARGKDPFA